MAPRQHRINPHTLERARELRRDMSMVERLLWSRLRRRDKAGVVFRRQHVIGPFVADFCCPKARLVIELDGRSHATNAAHDDARTTYLESAGYRVIRFFNEDVLNRMDEVLATIAREAGLP